MYAFKPLNHTIIRMKGLKHNINKKKNTSKVALLPKIKLNIHVSTNF